MSKKQKLDLTDFLTSPLRDEETTSIITNLFNRFLSEEQSVRINGQIGQPPSPDGADMPSVDLDRELNALIPALYYKTGSEERAFTFDDLVDRLEAIGVDTNDLRGMLAEQNFNFIPPINLDKFINYSSYYWMPVTNIPPFWNTDLYPEYYVMELPKVGSIYQMPVRVATDRNIKLYGKDREPETITVVFSSATSFTLAGNRGTLLTRTTSTIGSENVGAKTIFPSPGDVTPVWVLAPDTSVGASYGMDDPNPTNDELFTFLITTGSTPFQAGDTFTINITYITGTNTVALTSVDPVNKGFISNIIPDLRFMYVDGLQLSVGDAVLVGNQTNTEENGIYTVTSTKWVRRINADTEESLPQNTVVFVDEGAAFQGNTYTLLRALDSTFVMDDPVNGAQTWNLTSTTEPSYLNEWQTYNFWIHVDDLQLLSSSVQATAVQAKRPIIEYCFGLELNKFIDATGNPSNTGTAYEQQKTVINQLPQFDLYRYDGTHALKTSPVFFYVEDPDYPVDAELQRRVKTNANPDFIFSTGVQDEVGRLLFWKKSASIETIWTPGPNLAQDYLSQTKWADLTTAGVTVNEAGTTASVQYADSSWVGAHGDRVVDNGRVYFELRLLSTTNIFAGLGTYAPFDPQNPTTTGLKILFSSNTNAIITLNNNVATHLGLAGSGGAGITFGGDKVLQVALDMTAGTIALGVSNVWSTTHSFPELIGLEVTPFVVAANAAGNTGTPQIVELRTKSDQFSGQIPVGFLPFEDLSSVPT